MVAILIAGVVVGVTGYTMKADAGEVLQQGLNYSMYRYANSSEDTAAWDEIQEDVRTILRETNFHIIPPFSPSQHLHNPISMNALYRSSTIFYLTEMLNISELAQFSSKILMLIIFFPLNY